MGAFFVTVMVCVTTAIMLHWKELVFGSPEQVMIATSIIFFESQIVFKTYFKNSWLRWKIQGLPIDQGEKETMDAKN
jgi:hypothetical protein